MSGISEIAGSLIAADRTINDMQSWLLLVIVSSYEKKFVAVLVYGSVAVLDFEFMVAFLDMAWSSLNLVVAVLGMPLNCCSRFRV